MDKMECQNCENHEVCKGLLKNIQDTKSNLRVCMSCGLEDVNHYFKQLETHLGNYDAIRLTKCI